MKPNSTVMFLLANVFAGDINTATNTAGTSGGTASQLDNNIMDIYSQEVIFVAQPILRFEAFTSEKTELGIAPGLTIKFLKYAVLTGGGALTENTDMTTDTISSSQITITVTEHGKATSVTEQLLRSSFTDVMSDVSILLGQNLARYRDGQIRDALIAGSTNTLFAKGRSGRANLTATDYLDTALIREAVETLASSKAPKINGDSYVCFIHPHQARYLRTDSDWVHASAYGAPGQLFAGEIGRFEDVRFIETTQIPYIAAGTQDIWIDGADSGSNTGGAAAPAGVDVHQGIIIGDHAVGRAISLEAELRDNGIKDFGRRHELAWYGIWGVDVIEAGHSAILETA